MFSNSNIKKIYLILIFILSQTMAFSQSAELKEAFNNVSRTLKDYKFKSEDAYGDGDGKTISIKIQLKGGYIIFVIVDDFSPFNDSVFGNKPGTKILKVPIQSVELDHRYSSLYIKNEDGVEYTYKNKKELLHDYSLHGEDLSLKKLTKELQDIISLAKKENFNGNLGVPSSSSNSSSSKPENNTTKTVGKYVQ